MSSKIRTLQLKLAKAQASVNSASENLERELSDAIEFDFSIQHQQSDGNCILKLNSAQLAPLGACILIIERDGKLTEEQFLNHRI